MVNILLVEDDLALSMGIVYALKKEGFNIFHGENIAKSKEILKSKEIDLILLDVMLPDGDGYNFCEEIIKVYGDSKGIIFMTACDEEFNIVLGLDIGGDDYITKPLRIKEVTSRINAVLRRKKKYAIKSSDEEILISGNITLYKSQYKATKENIDLKLTLLEYKLLSVLLENSPAVVSREMLLDKLWDFEGNFVDGNTLNVYIKRLREKVEVDIKNPKIIDTVRGVGYVWKLEVEK